MAGLQSEEGVDGSLIGQIRHPQPAARIRRDGTLLSHHRMNIRSVSLRFQGHVVAVAIVAVRVCRVSSRLIYSLVSAVAATSGARSCAFVGRPAVPIPFGHLPVPNFFVYSLGSRLRTAILGSQLSNYGGLMVTDRDSVPALNKPPRGGTKLE